jgi:hypothetical protein
MAAVCTEVKGHGRHRSARRVPRLSARRRLVALGAGMALTFAAVGGVVAASASVKPTPSVFSAIASKKLLSAKTLNAGKVDRIVVAGGKSGVPKTATSVQLVVTVAKGTSTGSLDVYPNGRSATAMLHWSTGQTVTSTITVPVGKAGRVAFRNATQKVTVTAALTGYYTPALVAGGITASDFSGHGTKSGEVLTATKTGVHWVSPAVTYTVSPTSADFLYNSQYLFVTAPAEFTEWFTRYYNMSVPALTQSALDNGSVQVYVNTAPGFDANQWLPMPYSFDSGAGYTFNLAYVTSPGQVQLAFYISLTDPSATLPALSTYAMPTYAFKVVVSPGTAGVTAQAPAVARFVPKRGTYTCRPIPGGRTCSAKTSS